VIDNGIISLGVGEFGQLNDGGVGVKYLPNNHEATITGCDCEGWGVGIGETGLSGYANIAGGIANVSTTGLGSTATTATSIVTIDGTNLRVTHFYSPAVETANLYRVNVKIENLGATDIADLRYTRTFDWDVDPTAFNEFVTIQGVATTPSVLLAINNGFVSSDPFAARNDLGASGDFIDFGSFDHGANFDFGFGALLAGAAYDFQLFFGAADTEKDMLAALGAVGVELYSLGQPAGDPLGLGLDASGNPTTTFGFGFKGVGGVIIVDPPAPVPVPASGLLLLGALGLFRMRRKAKRAA